MFSGPFFYISAALLLVVVLAITVVGMRSDDFPPKGRLGQGLTALVSLLVITTIIGAIAEARLEQKNRRAEIAAEEMEQANLESEAPEGEGEAGPGLGTGEPEGAQVFADQGCGGCHALVEAGTTGQIGPALDEALLDKDEDYIRTAIVDPNAVLAPGYGAGVMPADYADDLSEEEIDVLVDYLSEATSDPSGEDPADAVEGEDPTVPAG